MSGRNIGLLDSREKSVSLLDDERRSSTKFTNVNIAGFGQSQYLVGESEMFVEGKSKITNIVGGVNCLDWTVS